MARVKPLVRSAYCYYCKSPFNHYDRASPRYPTKDHKVPRAKGGRNTPDNIVMACSACNYEKGCMSVAEFREYLQVTAGPYGFLMRRRLWEKHKRKNANDPPPAHEASGGL